MKIYTKRLIKVGLTRHLVKAYLAILLIPVLIHSCKGQKNGATNNQTEQEDSDNLIELLVSDYYDGSIEEDYFVIKDSGALKKFYSKINKTRKPGIPLPDIDFSKNALLVYFPNVQESDKGSLRVKQVTEDTVYLKTKDPNKASSSTSGLRPFLVYRISEIDKKIIIDSD
ncbi:hypothetical protein D1013_14215 [Euzebyella marina]|uniref:Uncharacterized protein n=1 Tax=Euzebyella marina TaxID=1761453 RepID=A0A3G2L872_9FLAO|nr:hypothetical protein D1013_14215 [Euzebyella marina]